MNAYENVSFPRRAASLSVPDDLQATTRFLASDVLDESDILSSAPSLRSASGVRPVAVRLASFVERIGRELRALRVPSRTEAAFVCGGSGALLIVGGLVAGWQMLPSHWSPSSGMEAAAVIIARVAMAIATIGAGTSLLRMAERLSRPASSGAQNRVPRNAVQRSHCSSVAVAARAERSDGTLALRTSAACPPRVGSLSTEPRWLAQWDRRCAATPGGA